MTTELTIERVGHRGDGLATGPDGPIFVRRALPGEVVTGEIEGDRMATPRILTPSSDRIRPPCSHAKTCGGCAVQHWRDDAVADWKLDIVRRALSGHGLEAPLWGPVTSPPQSRRRASFAGRRTKSGAMIGFHAQGSDQVIDTPQCHLVRPEILAARPVMEALVRTGASRKDTLTLSVTLLDQGIEIAVTGGKPAEPGPLAALAAQHGLVRLVWEGEVLAQATLPTLQFDGIKVSPPPGAFLQATAEGEAALRDAVTNAVGDASHIADLFAGCGTFALPLARQARIHAVEGDRALTDALEGGWRHGTGLKALTTETRDLFRRPLLPDEIARFGAIILDPPRAGAHAQCAELAQAKPPRIAMVSCNPVTFARDTATLTQAGYRLDWVQVVDQFRWSTHVELVAQLTLPHIAA